MRRAQSLQSIRAAAERRAWVGARARAPRPGWRRLFVFGGAVALTAYGASEMYGVVEVGEVTPLEWALVVLFVVNFSWIALASPRACVGFVWLFVERAAPGPLPAASATTQTAVVMPIYNEAPSRVFGALQAIYEDVEATGLGDAFDYFFLSDTTDPNIWIAEERALLAMRERLPRRARSITAAGARTSRRKAGNIADFVIRWGGRLSADGGARRRQPDDRPTRSCASPRRWRPIPTPASFRACR